MSVAFLVSGRPGSEPVGRDAGAAHQDLMTALDAAQALHRQRAVPDAVAGQGTGEVTAAVLAGVLTPAEARTLLTARAAALAGEQTGTRDGMVAVVRVSRLVVELLVDEHDELVLEGDHAEEQLTVAGSRAALAWLEGRIRDAGGACVPLEGCAVWRPAVITAVRTAVREVLASIAPRAPRLPLLSATTGGLLATSVQAHASMVAQAGSPRRWREVQRALVAGGVARVVELPPVTGLRALAGRSMPGVQAHAVGDQAALDRCARDLVRPRAAQRAFAA